MTQADRNFIETCKEILEHGYSSEGTNVRTRWEDGTEANYISIVGVTNKYDVGKEFPMITLRNNSGTVKRAIDEILWIWQKKSNNVKDLNSNIALDVNKEIINVFSNRIKEMYTEKNVEIYIVDPAHIVNNHYSTQLIIPVVVAIVIGIVVNFVYIFVLIKYENKMQIVKYFYILCIKSNSLIL